MSEEWKICADTGGTFTDVYGVAPDGSASKTKVLSSACLRTRIIGLHDTIASLEADWDLPADFFKDWHTAPVGGSTNSGIRIKAYDPVNNCVVVSSAQAFQPGDLIELRTGEPAPVLGVRMLTRTPAIRPLPPHTLRLATTRGTNALLEGKVAKTCFFVTEGLADLLFIGDQRRPDLFALNIEKARTLHSYVVEVPGRLSADGSVLQSMRVTEAFRSAIREARKAGCDSAAVALLHSYKNPEQEKQLEGILREAGFSYVALSSELAPMIKILPRAQTTVADASLGLIMNNYLDAVENSLSGGRLLAMTSAGGLLPRRKYHPKDSLLSGPAGGVVGASVTGKRAGYEKVIAFDMGGTSTDVSRCEGHYQYQQQHTVGDATIVAPALPIITVAAGGGSICDFDGRSMFVGPESAGASPGPACYGAGGPLTISDVHLLLGRLRTEGFGIPVYPKKAEAVLKALQSESGIEPETLLVGFLRIANECMADAIRKISVREGYDPADYALLSFGGAGGLHACALAELLDMSVVIVPADAGLLSAYGLHHAAVERIATRQVLKKIDDGGLDIASLVDELAKEAKSALQDEGFAEDALEVRQRDLKLRCLGQESDLSIPWCPEDDLVANFLKTFEGVFGYTPLEQALDLVSVQVVVSTKPPTAGHEDFPEDGKVATENTERVRSFCGDQWHDAAILRRSALKAGNKIPGPAIISDEYSALVVEPGWCAVAGTEGSLRLNRVKPMEYGDIQEETVRRELFTNRFRGIVEEMGEQLRRTAISTNVKERMDYSCALLNPDGWLIANAPHIPVHLGAMGLCVRSVVEQLDLQPGDIAITNHPAFGGSHLPDLTVITPVFDNDGICLGYVANRAHHAEIGGKLPGSMPPDARCLADEGVVIAPVKLFEAGRARWEQIEAILSSGLWPSRAPAENLADIRAQVAANRRGSEALQRLCQTHGRETVFAYMDRLMKFSETSVRQALSSLAFEENTALERLDDGTSIKVCITKSDHSTLIDLSGTSPVHPGNFNATPAIVHSAVLYVLRLLINEDVPLNDGLLKAVRINLPECFLNPRFDHDAAKAPAVVAGNVETSQRLVDTLLKAFDRVACSQGTMNNLVFGNGESSYYETICGGAGAGPGFAGRSCVHSHMTNTAITDPEILEHRYPVRLKRFLRRRDSGGRGQFNGGDGVIREIEFLSEMDVSLNTQHRIEAPYGCHGGNDGSPGHQFLIKQGSVLSEAKTLKGSDSFMVKVGDCLIIETPGGGAWGKDHSQG